MNPIARRFRGLCAGLAVALVAATLFSAAGRAHGQTAPGGAPTTTAAPAAPAAAPAFDATKGDPAGVNTGDKSNAADASGTAFVPPSPADTDDAKTKEDKKKALDDYNDLAKKEPLAVKLADSVGHVRVATNMAWTLNTGYLVLFMQAGFALLTTGLIRKKNAGHLMMLNFAAYVFAFIAYFAVGFAFMFGAVAAGAGATAPGGIGGVPPLNHWLIPNVLGGTGWFLTGHAYDAATFGFVMFEIVFMETAGYIIVGSICERITFGAFILCELFVGAILYPMSGAWTWGGGWLAQLGNTMHLGHGYCDFAGSTVVHMVGGMAAMALSIILGARIGKYGKDGKARAFPGHNLVFVVSGTFILLFGWMGFNPGSTLAATDLRCAVVAINTNLAAVFGATFAMLFWYLKFKKPDISMACNGMLAGLVAITAPCAFVGPLESCAIGALAGLLVCAGVLFNDNVIKVDDPCGAISVHGYCGWLGAISLGIFADGTYGTGWNGTADYAIAGHTVPGVAGLLHGDVKQFLAQLIGSTAIGVWAFGSTFVVFKVVNSIKSMRVSKEAELEGLDVPEFGTLAYPEDEYPSSGLTTETALGALHATPLPATQPDGA
jgi:Amt family ammonium transporter